MVPMVEAALAALPAPAEWRLYTGVRLTRLRTRIDAVLVTDRAVLAFAGDRARAEAAALDLADFHEGCRGVPVLPVALLEGVRVVAQQPLPLAGAAPAVLSTRLLLLGLLRQVMRFPPVPGFDPAGWDQAAYRPVPGLIDAACRLYASHGAESLLLATSGRTEMARTRAAVERAVAEARAADAPVVVFVTGLPGAGKTLAGLDIAFQPGAGAAFLTGNPALLHVLRAALVRDAGGRGLSLRAARQRVEGVIQPLHLFRDHHLAAAAPPPDRVLVIDEAQRAWTASHAVRKTQNRAEPLEASEPALLLDIMGRHAGWCAVVCLIGGGQEIHAGEGGLAAWGEALRTRPRWRVVAPPPAPEAQDARQSLGALLGLRLDAALHLGCPVRAHRSPGLVGWVDAMLGDDPVSARRLSTGVRVRVTRSLAALRRALVGHGEQWVGQRAGLVASSFGRRLRAEGLGGLLWHQDEDAVAQWFLDTWPDVRSSDALEVAATEFGVQGLELDRIGVCWDLDLVRAADGRAWVAQAFRGSAWTRPKAAEALSNRCNAYRVLLTRARRDTVVWVPQGDARDRTRDPARYDAVAAFLLDCGAAMLDEGEAAVHHTPQPDLRLPLTKAGIIRDGTHERA